MRKIILILAAVCGVLVAFFLPGYSELQKLRRQNEELKERISILRKNNYELEDRAKKMEQDPAFREKIAREKIGVVRKGEVVYNLGGEHD